MRPVALGPFDKEIRIKSNACILPRIELHQPAIDAFRIELLVDRAVERVREINAPPVAADLDHLRPAVERATPGGRMTGACNDAADSYRTRQLGLERVGDIVL